MWDRIEVMTADTMDPAEPLRTQNPLGRFPRSFRRAGRRCSIPVSSSNISTTSRPGVLLPGGEDRFRVLRLQALADGLLDAALLQVYEGALRPADRHDQKWVQHQSEKVDRALCGTRRTDPSATSPTSAPSPSPAHWATSTCASREMALRPTRASSRGWTHFAAKVPAFEETRPH